MIQKKKKNEPLTNVIFQVPVLCDLVGIYTCLTKLFLSG